MNNLSEEELLELGKINASPDQAYRRFLSEHFIFRISYVFLSLYAFSFFVYANFATQNNVFPVGLEIINTTYVEVLQARLFVMIIIFVLIHFTYVYDKFFKIVIVSVLLLLSNYSIDMYLIFGEYLSEVTIYGRFFWLTRPLFFLAIFGLLFFYDKPKRLN